MKRFSVLIPDADAQLNVACCLSASKQAVVHGFTPRPVPILRHSRFFASFEEQKGEFNVTSWLNRIGEIVVERKIDVVLPTGDFGTRTLSEHRQALGCPCAWLVGRRQYRHALRRPAQDPSGTRIQRPLLVFVTRLAQRRRKFSALGLRDVSRRAGLKPETTGRPIFLRKGIRALEPVGWRPASHQTL